MLFIKKTLWFIFIFFWPLKVTAAPVNVSDFTSDKRPIRVGHVDLPPFYFSSGPNAQGLDPSIFREVAKRAGFKKIDFILFHTLTDLKNALDDGKIDVMACGFLLTEERTQNYGVSIPYYLRGGLGALFCPEQKTISTASDLQNLQVGCITGSYAGQWLLEKSVPASSIKKYNTVTELMNALDQQQVDAILTNFTFCRYHEVKSNHQWKSVLLEQMPIVYLLHKENAALRQAINTALDSMWKDGSLYTIKREILNPIDIEPAQRL